jgi:uroporphyrinogen-III decarboxylase
MTNDQWQILLDVIAGKRVDPLPVGFIIDCPWLPAWADMSTIDYFRDDHKWFHSNLQAIQRFPDVLFLPGFWSEFGMCTEPASFGAKCAWHDDRMPFADKVIHAVSDIDRLKVPDPKTDGLTPFVINRLVRTQHDIEQAGHRVRFSVTRGPLNIASFLMGATEFLIALRDDPKRIHQLLSIITEFTITWLTLQKSCCPTIDGLLLLDDIIGFCGPGDFDEFAYPYLKAIFDSQTVTVKMLHNDADGKVCAGYLADLGVNLFNFSFLHSLDEMKQWTSGKVALLGNIPPRDCLALGSQQQIKEQTAQMLTTLNDPANVIFSCGGGMPDGVSSENIDVFVNTVHNSTK